MHQRFNAGTFWGVHYNWEALASGVYRCRLPFLDVTVGLILGEQHVLIIDCGTTLLESEAIAADLYQICNRSVSRVLLTHHHFDHVLGLGTFDDAEIYAAPAVARVLVDGLAQLRMQAMEYGAVGTEVDRAAAAARPPDHQVTRADLALGGRSVHVEHVGAGHTDHDLVAVVHPSVDGERTVVFCGDLIEESADPAIDAESDIAAWPSALDRLLTLGGPDAMYVPGHGATVDAAFVRRQRDWLLAQH